jgi:hypothetical protein
VALWYVLGCAMAMSKELRERAPQAVTLGRR